MVATMLSRLLPSKTKMASTIQSHDVLNEKFGYSQPQQIEIDPSAPEHHQITELSEQKPRITFDDGVRRPSATRPMAVLASSRKHSYASVKEDSEIPQSFTSRHLLSERNPRLSDSLLRGPGFDTQIELELSDCLHEEHEVAITDTDEESEAELVSSSAASIVSHDSILSATRRHAASLETMPDEILDIVFSLITLDAAKDRYVDPRVDLFACLQVSKTIHAAALRVLYRHVKIPQSKAFFKFTNSLAQDSHLGELVQCLDFSHYSSIGFGRTKTTHTAVPYLTPMTLKACLERTKYLKAFLVHEHVDDELDIEVLTQLFNKPSMRAIDLCSCSSKSFTEAFTAFTKIPSWFDAGSTANFLSIERLSLHECTTLRPQVFEVLLPRLARLTHLDVAHTMVDDRALLTIPSTARITHLNLERCTQLTGSAVVKFVTQHPAVRDSIVYLNLMADASRYRLLSEQDLHELLPALPQTLRSLNLGGARVNSSHTRHLRALATHLEELGLKGASLSLSGDIVHILSLTPASAENDVLHPEWRSSLRYIDLTDIKTVSKMSLTYSPTTIIGDESVPLEVIELGSPVLDDINKSVKKQKNPEWIVRELGRRGWFVRQTSLLPNWLYTPDDGYRKWKMGARWWGMRKIPMYEQETGGMYGYFMFKRN